MRLVALCISWPGSELASSFLFLSSEMLISTGYFSLTDNTEEVLGPFKMIIARINRAALTDSPE